MGENEMAFAGLLIYFILLAIMAFIKAAVHLMPYGCVAGF